MASPAVGGPPEYIGDGFGTKSGTVGAEWNSQCMPPNFCTKFDKAQNLQRFH